MTLLEEIKNGFYIVSGEPVPGIMQPKIKCGVFRGTQKGDFVDRRTFEGNAVSQIEGAYGFVLRNLRVGSEIVGTQRRDVYELPLDSIREAICNAVFHRDYLEPSSIYVALYDDRLEILSPGGLVKDFSLEDAINGFSKLRNNALGDALEYMKEVEAWGGGVSRYFSACAAAGLQQPTVAEDAGFFKVVFWRRMKDVAEPGENRKLNIESSESTAESSRRTVALAPEAMQGFSMTTRKNIEQIVKELGGRDFFHRQDVADGLGLKPVAAHYLLQKMLAKGIIEPVSGHGKGAYRFSIDVSSSSSLGMTST